MRSASCETKDGEELVLKSINARGRVVGRMLDMTLEQHFTNPEPQNIEVVYTFPLPWQAVLLGLEVDINGQTLKSQVKAKTKARANYEEALSEGNTGILLAVNRNGSYTLELGNLMKGESCTIRLHYVQILQPEQGSLRLTLPTTIAPRYGNPIVDGGYDPHAVPTISATVEYPFNIHLTIEGELAQAQIGSPSHQVNLRSIPALGLNGPFVAEVGLGANAWLDRDFVLVFSQLTQASQGLASWDQLDEGMGVVMANFTPKLPPYSARPVSMKILVDCSGSMNGGSIQAARSALHRILHGIGETDRFSLSRFGSNVEHRSKAMWKGAPAALAASHRWVEQLAADLGGTEMEEAILSTLRLPGKASCDVLLITDGEIEAIGDVLETAQQSQHRFFIVGIGSAVAEVLLRRLAEDTGGSCEFVVPGEQVEPAIVRLYHRMRSPALTHARVEWPADCRLNAASNLPKSLFDGDDVTVFARLQAPNPEALNQCVRLMGRIDGDGPDMCLAELNATFIADEANTLARLAAHQRYTQLRKSTDPKAVPLARQLPSLAEKYQLVTEDTSLVLVKERAEGEQALDMPILRKVDAMLAAGWGGTGQTRATSSSQQVKFSKAPRSTNSGAAGIASGSMPVPSVWRKPQVPSAPVAASDSMPWEDFEIPAFLRKVADAVMPDHFRTWKAPSSDSKFWVPQIDGEPTPESRDRSNAGLSPAGLWEGLRSHRSTWPNSYHGLTDIDLVTRVIDWLEFTFGSDHEEEDVVTAFLEVMHALDFQLGDPVGGAIKALGLGGDEWLGSKERGLQGQIAQALVGINATTWPSSVVDYAELGQGE